MYYNVAGCLLKSRLSNFPAVGTQCTAGRVDILDQHSPAVQCYLFNQFLSTA